MIASGRRQNSGIKEMNGAILDRYRCPKHFAGLNLSAPLSGSNGYFRFGHEILCYGQSSPESHTTSRGPLPDLLAQVRMHDSQLFLPFNPTHIIENLTHERYMADRNSAPPRLAKHLYYLIRPFLPIALRARLQRIYFGGWDRISFPHWPLDLTVEHLFERLLLLLMKAAHLDAIPFIWFWPDGASCATILTHDVETPSGLEACPTLMDLDESFGFQASFQIVPENRYTVTPAILNEIRSRGHKIVVHDLKHDGHLFRNSTEFSARVKRINQYGRDFGARGFRSAILYRNLNWYDQFEFAYDMSVPNIGHLDPQRGGCCTVFPYFIGDILELPVTTTQDYALFHTLRDYRLDLWRAQAAGIMEKHGLLSFVVHPDYIFETRAENTYRALLDFLSHCRSKKGMWIATADDVDQWWRQRAQMTLAGENGSWRIEGHGKERAQIAYARALGEKIVYDWPGSDRSIPDPIA